MKTVQLKKNEDRRARAGHLWIYSNEISNVRQEFVPGELVDVFSSGGNFIGRGYINPQSLISVRLLARERREIDKDFFAERIRRADQLRQTLYPNEKSYRLAYGEADGLPGLVIDRYEDVYVIQVSTLGMYVRLAEILGALPAAGIAAAAVILRTDTPMAQLEGFPEESRVLSGECEHPVRIRQDGLLFDVDVLEGQKTGLYLDQRDNRVAAARLFAGARVLDCFSYMGAWGLYAGFAGARDVLGLDSSSRAIEAARRHAELNSLEPVCRFEEVDVFERLEDLTRSDERFDCIVLDPPALVKSKRHLPQGEAAYERLNRLAMTILSHDGFLISCSCSFHVSGELFWLILSRAARKKRRSCTLIEWRGQSRDHPIPLAMPETSYLKCAFLRVS
ncbi:MAG: class I SAM-dependent rRNA methyltransferase [Candidatus Abyssobacteria bacterium SURF_5]|uniref:Class I SAM-dependent rRNA methyltransferase n=1 Tax=Abyssobacteria bacterium (strain SURF_5) TaxID=2093360 RepID=A0A3A4P6P2_ABYX5|nr:MAG: class I SAM-dependent rRNA methyltransferase [Candidatus Abyssubacteria bacterium SURF_5]